MDSKLVHIFQPGRLIKTYVRQARGGRATEAEDYPAELSVYTTMGTHCIKSKAAEPGPAVAEFAGWLFDGPLPWVKVRRGHKLLRLGERYTAKRLDAACRRALHAELIDVRRVERILAKALEQETLPELSTAVPTSPGPAPSCQWRRKHETARHNHSEAKPRAPALPRHIFPPRKVYWADFSLLGRQLPFAP